MKKCLLPSFFRCCVAAFLLLTLPAIGTAQWTVSYNGSQITGTTPMVWNVSVVDSDVVWASVTRDYGIGTSSTFFRTTDGGSTWTSKNVTDAPPMHVMANVHALNADTAWAILWRTPDQDKSRIYKTSDGGDTWVEKTFPFTGSVATALISIHFFNDSEGFAYAEAKDTADWYVECYYTQDGGETWHLATVPEVPGSRVFVNWGNTNYAVIGDTAWFGASHSRIYRSIDKGISWDTLHVPYYHIRATGSVTFRDASNGIAATIISDSLGGYYALLEALRTHDGGLTWEHLPVTDSSTLNRIFRMLGMTVIPGSGGAYMAYGYKQAGLQYQQLISVDDGKTWNFVTGPYSRIRCMQFISPNMGWGGGWRQNNFGSVFPAVYKWTGSAILDSKEAYLPEIQIDLTPNPAIDYLQVTANAEAGEAFQVQLIDLSGKVWQHLEIQGGMQASFDLSFLNTGIYMVKIFNNTGATVGKVIKL